MDSDTGNTYYSKTQVRLRESTDKKVHRVWKNTESFKIWELGVLNCRKDKKN